MAALVGGIGALVVALATGRGEALFGSSPWRVTVPTTGATLALGALVLAIVVGTRSTSSPPSDGGGATRVELAVLAGAATVAAVPHVLGIRWFDSPAREDQVVEWATALAAASACALVLVAARRASLPLRLALWATAPVLFVMAGEEVSWLQRLLGYGTPDAFSASSQGEANLHNLSTDRFQSAFYLAGCVALVVVPHLARWAPRSLGPFAALAPGRLAATFGALAVGFTYARTGNLVHHVTAWAVVAVLVSWGGASRRWAWTTLAVTAWCQLSLVVVGPDLIRPWSPAEYRELLIALGLLAWAGGLAARGPLASRFTGSSRDVAAAAPTVWR
ncbi:hypothetical protein [Actinomarinicola tropica]|uniref:Uncharacterized protein n=1 Tax=Actinomarinicola tropica TaxID=2789776 RepID=A0A5Q2RGU9_9ACTN|nr:hypothetical protein [Actinomarinicola tropica]QGG94963.1 hypothetical protein GH723_07480 [Actinomarinicola tropica]